MSKDFSYDEQSITYEGKECFDFAKESGDLRENERFCTLVHECATNLDKSNMELGELHLALDLIPIDRNRGVYSGGGIFCGRVSPEEKIAVVLKVMDMMDCDMIEAMLISKIVFAEYVEKGRD